MLISESVKSLLNMNQPLIHSNGGNMLTDKEINDLCREIAEETMDVDAEDEELLNLLELEKQYEFLTYAEDAANLDAEFYGVA